MIGKYVVLAFVCASLVQVRGDELENAIKKGLYRVKGIYTNAQRRIDASIKDVDTKKSLIQTKSDVFISKSINVQDGIRKSLDVEAENARRRAQETGKPESVFRCIDNAEENGNNQVETLTRKFEGDITRLQRTKLANIETNARPLGEKQEALTVRYERAVKIIKNCDNPRCVDIAINSCLNWLEMMFADIRRIQGQVNTVYGNFIRDAANYWNNANRQITRIRSLSIRKIRQCMYTRETILASDSQEEEF